MGVDEPGDNRHTGKIDCGDPRRHRDCTLRADRLNDTAIHDDHSALDGYRTAPIDHTRSDECPRRLVIVAAARGQEYEEQDHWTDRSCHELCGRLRSGHEDE